MIVRLGDVFKVKKGKQLSRVQMIPTGKYKVYNGGVDYVGRYSNYNENKNTIIISEGGYSCGTVNYITEKFYAGGHCYVLHTKQNYITLYLYFVLLYFESGIKNLGVGSRIKNIHKRTLENFKLSINSNIQDQELIAKYLNEIKELYESL